MEETRCRHMGYSFRLAARVLLYASCHRQDNTYHGLCYTSRRALSGTRNSSMGPPHEGSIRRPIAPRSYISLSQKRNASSPLSPRTVTRPTSPSSPTRWEIARSRIKGRFKDYITPPFDNLADLPRKPPSDRWQTLQDEMGKIIIGLEGRSRPVLIITTFHGELFQQVVIDTTVNNATAHSLLRSLLGDGYGILLPSLTSLHTRHPGLQLSDSSIE